MTQSQQIIGSVGFIVAVVSFAAFWRTCGVEEGAAATSTTQWRLGAEAAHAQTRSKVQQVFEVAEQNAKALDAIRRKAERDEQNRKWCAEGTLLDLKECARVGVILAPAGPTVPQSYQWYHLHEGRDFDPDGLVWDAGNTI